MKLNEINELLDQVQPDLRNHAPFFIETLKAHLELLLEERQCN